MSERERMIIVIENDTFDCSKKTDLFFVNSMTQNYPATRLKSNYLGICRHLVKASDFGNF